MSISSRPDQFFQTDAALNEVNRKARKSYNLSGNPIKLPAKLLAVILDPADHGAVYVAGGAATVTRVRLIDGEVTHTYKGPRTVLTSICLSTDGTKLYAGCWDNDIWSWNIATCAPSRKFEGHRDFVKAVLCLGTPTGKEILASGGADGDVLLWDTDTGQRLGVVKGKSRAVQQLAVDPTQEKATIFASFSNPVICHFSLTATTDFRSLAFSDPIAAHPTSIYTLHFDSDGDLWTGSADKTAKHLIRANDWKADTTLTHPDFVRDIVVHEHRGWVVTACRDEEVRVWSLATGELHHTFSGHFEEVTALCLAGDKVISVSIDATIRQWSLAPADLKKAKEDAADPERAKEDERERQTVETDPSALTAEEERELAALMENEERELQELIAADEQ